MPYQLVNFDQIAEPLQNNSIGISINFNGPTGMFSKTFTSTELAVNNLKNLLLTNKGERVFQPTFGTDLPQILFEPNTARLKVLVEEFITDAVNYWLPYIFLTNIETTTADDDPTIDHQIIVKISFYVNLTGTFADLQTITIFADETQLTVV
jgi:phage baseplate assembly protein W